MRNTYSGQVSCLFGVNKAAKQKERGKMNSNNVRMNFGSTGNAIVRNAEEKK